jgi:hypothetical protein
MVPRSDHPPFETSYQLIDEESTLRIGFFWDLLLVRSKCAKNPPNGYNSKIRNAKSFTL